MVTIPDNISGRVLSTLKAIEPELTIALRRLATYVLEHPQEAASMKVIDLAQKAKVGEATVIRLVKTLNFPGYKELQRSLYAELAIDRTSLSNEDQILDSNINDQDDCLVMAKKLKLAINRSLTENIKSIDDKILKTVSDAIYKARKVFIIGVGNSCLSALFLKNKLCRIGIDAQAEGMTHFMYTSLAMLSPSDVVLAISQKGSSYETIKAFEIGKEAGALSVVITNSPMSRLAQLADYVIFNGNEEGSLQGDSAATITAQLHICELLYAMVVALNRPKAVKTKQLTLKALGKEV